MAGKDEHAKHAFKPSLQPEEDNGGCLVVVCWAYPLPFSATGDYNYRRNVLQHFENKEMKCRWN